MAFASGALVRIYQSEGSQEEKAEVNRWSRTVLQHARVPSPSLEEGLWHGPAPGERTRCWGPQAKDRTPEHTHLD